MVFEYSELVKLIRYKYGTQEKFAKALSIGRVSLSKRLNNKLQFSQEEILSAAKLLNISEKEIPRYFFKEKVQKHEL
jgi:transcriptional regulator with XRE-family HTH domain